MNNDNNKHTKLSFQIIDSYISKLETLPNEVEKTDNYTLWGKNNNYPKFIFSIANEASTLNSIIKTVSNYVAGDGVEDNELIDYDLIYDIAESYAIFGGFALDIVKDLNGSPMKIECLDMRYVRTDKFHTKVWYNEKFNDGYARGSKSIILPTQNTVSDKDNEYVFLFTNSKYFVYPTPIWISSIKSAIVEAKLDDFHLNDIDNNFTGNIIFNFYGGIPEDKEKREIERAIDEKFCGTENAGRPIINFADNKDKGLEVSTVESSDFGDRYNALMETSRQKQFTAWRCSPSLCGIPEIGTGFNATEYEEQYKLFYANVIRPMQKVINNSLSKITNSEIKIIPMQIDFGDE